MPYIDTSVITDPGAVTAALDEFDQLGRRRFLEKFAYGESRQYFVERDGKLYDSKPILGVAYGHQYPDEGPLHPQDFSGGADHAVRWLRQLGFTVKKIDDRTGAKPTAMLFYWRQDDYVKNREDGPSYHLNRSQPKLHDLETGDSLCAFTRTDDGRYVLAAELVICAKTVNDDGYEYGRYRVWGDPDTSRYFDVDDQESIEPLLREMFQPKTAVLARSFQGPGGLRDLSGDQDERLREWASNIPTLDVGDSGSAARTEALVHREQTEADEEEAFSVDSIDDARERTIASIVRRRGQAEFRSRLIEAYDGRCAISGCDAVEALEAAHIVPYKGPGTNQVWNGLLLRAELHTLFDLGLVGIEPDTMTVVLAPNLRSTEYRDFQGAMIALPQDTSARPNYDALRWHCDRM